MASEIEALTAQIEAAPTDPWLFWDRGVLYSELRQWVSAIEDFTRAISLDSDEPAFWRRRGRVYSLMGVVRKAQEDLDRAIALDPEDPESYWERAWFFRWCHEYGRAVADLNRAVGLDPREPWYRYRRGLVRLAMDQPRKALGDLDEAIRLDPERPLFYYERARTRLFYGLGGRPEEALPDLEEAIRLDPSAVGYRTDRGYVRFCMGLWAEAAEDFACQDIPHAYRFCPYLGAQVAVWLYLARLFQGEHAAGLRAVREYLGWYEATCPSRGDGGTSPELWYWPVPLARLLAGEIDERQLREHPSLDRDEPGLAPCEVEDVDERVKEFHFVLGELALARGHRGEALLHLKRASGLPLRTPMSWVIARQMTWYV
jgi:tetratricopeptide (TPR) repeat protein